jgi:hypothetical protein
LAPLCSSPRDTGKPSLLVVSFQSSSSLPCVILPQTLPCRKPPHPTARAPPPAPLPSPPGVPPRPTGSGECPRSQDFEMELPTTSRRLAAPGCPPCRRQSWHGRAAVLWPPWPQLAAPLGEDSGPGRGPGQGRARPRGPLAAGLRVKTGPATGFRFFLFFQFF